MIKTFGQYILLFFTLVAFSTHVIKVIYLLFKPKILDKYPVFSNTKPSENYLLLYYLLTVMVTLAAVVNFFY